MNVFQMTQSLQSMVESIATTNPTDQYVSKHLHQNCMATVANNILELVKSVNQLTWGLNAGIQNLSEKLEKSEEATKGNFQFNNTKMSERLDRWDTSHTKVCNHIRELSDKVENIDTVINQQNITVLSDKLQTLEESNSRLQDSLQDISDRLNITELNNISLDQTIVKLSDSVSLVPGSVDNLHTSSSALMSKYQEQQSSIVSLTNNVTTLQENSTQVISHSTPKLPQGLPHRNIPNSPFFIPKPPPGFQTTFMPLQKTIGLTSEYLCMQENQSGPIKSGEFSPLSFNSATDTDLCKEVPVLQTDRDGYADLPQVSATPTKSVSNSPSIFISPDVSRSPVPDKISPQSTETKSSSNICAENHSDQSFQSIPAVSNEYQSFESNSSGSS